MYTVTGLFIGCGHPEPLPGSEAPDLGPTTTSSAPSQSTDATSTSSQPGKGLTTTVDCSVPLTAPVTRVWPKPGELTYIQLGLTGFSLGESALLVGPDGTMVAIDVGNDAHDDDLGDLINEIRTAMNSAGFPHRPTNALDHVVLTHIHADHTDGLGDLLEHVEVSGKVVFRGLYDMTEAVNTATAEHLCEALDSLPDQVVALCEGIDPAPCDSSGWSGTYPSTSCTGLSGLGDVTGADQGPAYLPLGDARLDLLAVNGHMGGQSYVDQVGPFLEDDLNGENARSLVGVVSHGLFRLMISGDLTAESSDSDPLEEFYTPLLGELTKMGVDVYHAGHHGRDSSNSAGWVGAWLPNDGLDRNVIMGVSEAHLGSPYGVVLDILQQDDRLGDGRIWVNTVTFGGATSDRVVDAGGGHIVVQTGGSGTEVVVQALDRSGGLVESRAYHTVAGCSDEIP